MRQFAIPTAFLMAVLTLTNSPIALASTAQPTFPLLVYSEPFESEKTITTRKNYPIADVDLTMPEAVQLDSNIASDFVKKIGGNSKSPLSAGTLLFSWSTEHAYCGSARFSGVDKIAPCLLDTDNDGKFDQGFKVLDVAMGPPAGIVFSNGKIMGAFQRYTGPLPEPVAYHRVEKSKIPRMKGQLSWSSDYKSNQQRPVKIAFGFTAAGGYVTQNLLTKPTEIIFDGSPVTVDLHGVTITVQNIGPNGELIYQISGQLQAEPVDFEFQVDNTLHLYVYVVH
jgi:hypothetical protein